MIKSINFEDFQKAFKDYNRENQFEHTLEMLFEEIETIEQDTGEQYELDVIELCVEWTEQSLRDVANEEGVQLGEVFTALEDQGNDHLIKRVDKDFFAVMRQGDWDDLCEGLRETKEQENIERNDGISDSIDGFAGELNEVSRDLYNSNDKTDINQVIEEIEEIFEGLKKELLEYYSN